jgi:pimeloyl-ACP methyl ester carboxylesterase
MGTTGLALLAFTPGDDAMTRLSWVWPPVVLAMAVWMFVQVRRSVTGAGRWMLLPVVVALGLMSVGTTYENIAERSDQGTYTAPGKSYRVDGHRMHLDCRGQGGPTVVLLNGLGGTSASWTRIAGPVGQAARVCAYDRPGQGWSEATTHPQDGVAAAKDLHALLAAAGETGPFVLVGHSTGGTYAMTYAARYPEQVAGLVLLDSSSPYQLTEVDAYPGQYAVMRRGLALLPTLARFGVARLAPAPDLPAPADAQVQALTSTARSARNGRDEISVAPRVFAQARALTTLGSRPLAVLTTSESLTGAGWARAQDQLAALSTNRAHRTVDSTHDGLLADEAPAAASVRAVNEVLSAVRTGTPMEQK